MTKYTTGQLRNIAIVGHGSSGKTTIVESMLYRTGASSRLGRVEDGTSVSDWDSEEHRRGISINLAVVPVDFDNVRLNFIDTPGYLDFVGEMISGVKVAEVALVLVDAVAGVEVGTELAWDRLDELHKPRIVFVNKMDRENANFRKVIESLRKAFPESTIMPFHLPVGEADKFAGVVSLIDLKAYMGDKATVAEPPADMAEWMEETRLELVEAAAESDDELIMKYLEGEELTPTEVRHALHEGVRTGAIVPVFCGSALQGTGLTSLMRSLTRYVPAPSERAVHAEAADSGDPILLTANPDAPTVALVFKTIVDRFVGRMSYVRVFAGAIKKDGRLLNQRTGEDDRIANLFHVRGKDLEATNELMAGDIGVITKLDSVLTGDTLSDAGANVRIVPPEYPRPLFSVAVTPATKADSAKMGQALHALTEEDPTLRVQTISTTRQTVLQGTGDAHVDLAARRLESKFGTQVETTIPKVPYQETVAHKGQAVYRHKKQTGGSGQFAEVHLRVEPTERGEGFQYVSEVFGGAISGVFIPSIEKGIRQVIENGGVIAGYPVVDVKAIVFDGKEHPVDSKDIAFQAAGRESFKAAMALAGPLLLEPIYRIYITVPEDFMGDVMGDLTTRRGRVSGIEQKGNRSIVSALVPMAEIMRYGTDLRSMTQGRGTYAIEFDHYDPVPSQLVDGIVAAFKQENDHES